MPARCLRKDRNDRAALPPARGTRFVHDEHFGGVERNGLDQSLRRPTHTLSHDSAQNAGQANAVLPDFAEIQASMPSYPEINLEQNRKRGWLVWPYADQSATDDCQLSRDPQS